MEYRRQKEKKGSKGKIFFITDYSNMILQPNLELLYDIKSGSIGVKKQRNRVCIKFPTILILTCHKPGFL